MWRYLSARIISMLDLPVVDCEDCEGVCNYHKITDIQLAGQEGGKYQQDSLGNVKQSSLITNCFILFHKFWNVIFGISVQNLINYKTITIPPHKNWILCCFYQMNIWVKFWELNLQQERKSGPAPAHCKPN